MHKLYCGLVSLLLAGAVHAADLAMKDRAFLKDAAKGGLREVEMGQLGLEKAQRSEVRQLAQRIQSDHTKANTELMSLASRYDVEIPEEPRRERDLEHMQDLSGAEFDRMYVRHMVMDHQRDVQKYRTAAQTAENPDVRAFASRTLPILEEHLRMAQGLGPILGIGVHEAAGAPPPPPATMESDRMNPHLGGNRRYMGGDRTRRGYDLDFWRDYK